MGHPLKNVYFKKRLLNHLAFSVVFHSIEEDVEVTIFDELVIGLLIYHNILYSRWFVLYAECINTEFATY